MLLVLCEEVEERGDQQNGKQSIQLLQLCRHGILHRPRWLPSLCAVLGWVVAFVPGCVVLFTVAFWPGASAWMDVYTVGFHVFEEQLSLTCSRSWLRCSSSTLHAACPSAYGSPHKSLSSHWAGSKQECVLTVQLGASIRQ